VTEQPLEDKAGQKPGFFSTLPLKIVDISRLKIIRIVLIHFANRETWMIATNLRSLEGKFRDLPSRLTHYTTLDGLKGIIDSGEIWLSNVSFLNDRRELLYGVDEAAKIAKKFSSKETYAEWHKPLSRALTRLRGGKMPNTYAACFCEKSDILSQWRGYGGATQGIAITFRRKRLAEELKDSRATLYPVIYGQLNTADQITSELSDKLDDLEQTARKKGYSDDQKEIEAYSLICRLLPQFKHVGFSDEREWRIVIQHNTLRSGVDFRAGLNVLIPYLKLKLNGNGLLPVEYVRVGPGRDQELTKRSIELFLNSRGLTDVEVRKSSVPYRF
jgi:hypothetical protein